ncbi:double-strand-break repair protein rad21-like protein 1 [Protopterus annectens]|uniref:double-strand-break repair protein rad21-like protein 1 n=1 Tax=Protopterus annectens TaxID=7888 RepID=UPI001CFABDD2|nr:double-strand-break repair protein rad21-like protein 1 [Protopterus annectens]
MFYAHLLMSKRGPLAKIWLAAHWEKKLTKTHVFECNLETSVQDIISSKVKIALRTSGHLLLGVVRIYHRKAKYLLADCTEALLKIKMAFRPGLVDLPKEHLEATYNAITLPEEFHDFDTQLPDLNAIDVVEYFTLNQSRVEEITLREEYSSNVLLQDEGFGEDPEVLRQGNTSDDNLLMNTSESLLPDQSYASPLKDKCGLHMDKDGFGDEGAGDMLDALLNGENEDVFADLTTNIEVPQDVPVLNDPLDQYAVEEAETSDKALPAEILPAGDYTTLLQNEEEGFALEPVDASVVSFEKKRPKRRRKLIVDEVKELSSSNIREQINNSMDLVAPVDIAPPTKKLMKWKESGGVDYLLSNPGQCLGNPKLNAMFTRCLTFRRSNTRRSIEDVEEPRNEPQISDVSLLDGPDAMRELTCAESLSCEITSKLDEKTEDEENPQVDGSAEMLDTEMAPVELPMLLATNLKEKKDNEHSTEEEHVLESDEENKWNKRTRKMLHYLHVPLSTPSNIIIDELTQLVQMLSQSINSVKRWQSSLLLPGNLGNLYKELSDESEVVSIHEASQRLVEEQMENSLDLLPKVFRSPQEDSSTNIQSKYSEGDLNKEVDCFSLLDLCRNTNRKQASANFYSFLVLKKHLAIELHQDRPYADITATPGPKFHTI